MNTFTQIPVELTGPIKEEDDVCITLMERSVKVHDREGNPITYPYWEWLSSRRDDARFLPIQKAEGDKWAIYDLQARKFATPFILDNVTQEADNGFYVFYYGERIYSYDYKHGHFLPEGYEVVKGNYLDYSDRPVIIRRQGKYAMYNSDDDTFITPFEYDGMLNYWEVYLAKKDGKCVFISWKGQVTLTEYDEMRFYDKGSDYAKCRKNGKWGVIKRDNLKVILPFEYEDEEIRTDGCFFGAGDRWFWLNGYNRFDQELTYKEVLDARSEISINYDFCEEFTGGHSHRAEPKFNEHVW